MSNKNNERSGWQIKFLVAITFFSISFSYMAQMTTFPFIHIGDALGISPVIIAWIFLGLGVIGLLLVSIFGLLDIYIK